MTRTLTLDCPRPGCEGDSDCLECKGEGQITTDVCPRCDGERRIEESAPTWNDPYGTKYVRCPTCTEEPYPRQFDKLEPRR